MEHVMTRRTPRLRAIAVASCLFMALPAAGLRAQEPGSEFLTIENHPDTGEMIFALGPVDLPAHTDHHAMHQLPVQKGIVPFDFTVHAYRVEAVDGDGNPVPHEVIHHFNLLDPSQRELFLPIMRRGFAAGSETGPQHVPGWLLGLPFKGGAPFLMLTMLHNLTDRTYRGVHIRLVMEYSRSRIFPLYRFFPFHLETMFPLGSKAFDLPPGKLVKHWEGSPAISGRIMGLGGHLHNNSTSLTMEDLTTGDTLYHVVPVRDAEGHLQAVPVKKFYGIFHIGKRIFPSHTYRVTAEYFNPTQDTIRGGGMGSVAGGFVPDDEDDWPAADPNDPLYRQDYINVLHSLEMHMAAGMGHAPAAAMGAPGGPASDVKLGGTKGGDGAE